jgi:hypothetical protein
MVTLPYGLLCHGFRAIICERPARFISTIKPDPVTVTQVDPKLRT